MKRKHREQVFHTYDEYLQAVSGPPGPPPDETPEEAGRRMARESIESVKRKHDEQRRVWFRKPDGNPWETPGKLCRHPEHKPPSHMVFHPGTHEHVCPGCGTVTRFHVPFVTW